MGETVCYYWEWASAKVWMKTLSIARLTSPKVGTPSDRLLPLFPPTSSTHHTAYLRQFSLKLVDARKCSRRGSGAGLLRFQSGIQFLSKPFMPLTQLF